VVETGEAKSTEYLLQRLSVAVQKGNCASVLGACKPDTIFFFLFLLLYHLKQFLYHTSHFPFSYAAKADLLLVMYALYCR